MASGQCSEAALGGQGEGQATVLPGPPCWWPVSGVHSGRLSLALFGLFFLFRLFVVRPDGGWHSHQPPGHTHRHTAGPWGSPHGPLGMARVSGLALLPAPQERLSDSLGEGAFPAGPPGGAGSQPFRDIVPTEEGRLQGAWALALRSGAHVLPAEPRQPLPSRDLCPGC